MRLPDPLILPLAAVAAGVTAARFLPFDWPELSGGTAALAALALFALARRERRAALAAGLAAALLGGALVAAAHRRPPTPVIEAGPRETVILSGCVVEPPVFSADGERFVLELEPGARAQTTLYFKPDEAPPRLHYGQRVEIEGRVRPTHNYRNPGSFDYESYLARQDVYWNVSARAGAPVRVLSGDCGTRFGRFIFGLREAALDQIAALYPGDSYRTAMSQAILIGESTNLEKVWIEDFRRTGTYHALVISGLHIAVLAAFLLFVLRMCFVPDGIALTVATAAAWLYALVSGWQAPVVRGAGGFTFYALARLVYRRPRVLNLLAAIALGFILADPEQMFDASFQLSFLAVAAIGALAAPLLEKTTGPLIRGLTGLSDVGRDPRLEPRAAHFRVELRLLAETLSLWIRAPQRVCLAALGRMYRAAFYAFELFTLSTCVQIGLALPMALYFHRLSPTGLTANILIVPAMSVFVPVGFGAMFTSWRPLAAVSGWLLSFSQGIAGWHAGLEPEWRIPDPPWWLAIACAASIVAVAALRRVRPAFVAALAAAFIALALLVWCPFPPQTAPGWLELTLIDVGQGESALLAFPDGKLALVDAGGIPAFGRRRRSRLDTGEDVVSPYLWSRRIRRLDAIALSHPHEDHSGGLPAVAANFRPAELWVGAVSESPEWRGIREIAERRKLKVKPLRAGQAFAYGGARIEVLAPLPDYEAGERVSNNDSLVLRIRYGRRSFLLTGDIERRIERELVEGGALDRADVLKVAHHGSRTSTTAPFLDVVHPSLALISAGFGNQFNNPHQQTVARLEERRMAVFRTDRMGLISVRTDGRRLEAAVGGWF